MKNYCPKCGTELGAAGMLGHNCTTPTPPTEKCCDKCSQIDRNGSHRIEDWSYSCRESSCTCHTTGTGWEQVRAKWDNTVALMLVDAIASTEAYKDPAFLEASCAFVQKKLDDRAKEEYERGYHNGFKQGRFDTEMDTLNQPS